MNSKRVICMLLALLMCLSLFPISATAAETQDTTPTPSYIEDVKWTRGDLNANPESLFVITNESPYIKAFSFNPAKDSYSLVIPTLTNADAGSYLTVAFSDNAKTADNVYYRLTGISRTGTGEVDIISTNLESGATKDKDSISIKGTTLKIKDNAKETSNYPYTIRLEVGVLASGSISDGILEPKVTYEFDIVRCVAVSKIQVSAGDTQLLSMNSSAIYKSQDYSRFTVENVKAGTTELTLNLTYKKSTLQFDDGKGQGTYDTESSYSSATSFTLDLTKYENYRQADGTLEIPFRLVRDNTTGQCCQDAYYTLVLKFAEIKDSEINPTTATIAKSESGGDYQDIQISLTPNGNDFAGIWIDETQLASEAYSLEGTTVTLLKSWLEKLPIGETVLTFKFETGGSPQLKQFIITVCDNTEPPALVGYVKNITVIDTPSYSDHVYLDDFSSTKTTYDLGKVPDIPILPTFYLELEDEENLDSMRFSLVLSNADGAIIDSENNKFKKYAYDEEKKSFNLRRLLPSSITFGDIEPGNYVLLLKVFEEGKESSGEEYTFSFSLVPYLSSLILSAGGKQILTDPDISVRNSDTTRAIVRFNREYHAAMQGMHELSLKLTIESWINRGEATTDVSFLFNGKVTPAHYDAQVDPTTTIDAIIDISDCNNSEGLYTVPFSLIYGEGTNQVCNDYVLYVAVGEDAGWEITDYSQSGIYNKGDIATLFVTVSGERANKVTYQWQWTELSYMAISGLYNNGIDDGWRGDIKNAQEPTFTAPTTSSGRRFYRCVVTDQETGAYENTEWIVIDVTPGQVNPPLIGCQPGQEDDAKTEYLFGEKTQPIQITVGTTDMLPQNRLEWVADVSVEWYSNDIASTNGGTLIDRENYGILNTSPKVVFPTLSFCDRTDPHIFVCYLPETLEVGDYYFYCVVTAFAKDNSNNKASITSDVVKITVMERGELEGFEGNGVATDPYLIKTVEDLKKIDEYIMNGDKLHGAIFQFANDITIPVDWEPIGGNKGEYLPFGGTIDGNGKTLTYEKGARSLLEYAQDAVVKNLNIYGEEIKGAGLLEKATVDYGDDGIYQELTDPDIITVENVTLLSGSKTTGSGLVNGGYTSGINDVFIRNCTIQEGVVVGGGKDQSNIGSFVGTLNGRIENCVSYATVYGVNNVGGLAGKKGQSMGICQIINSAFLGTVEASGCKVGGILGAGYISYTAPNTPPVTIRNCYVIADIIGNSIPEYWKELSSQAEGLLVDWDAGGGIGGILGSEIGLRSAWNDAYICDNYFYGTIIDTNPDASEMYTRVGGIMGELGDYNPEHLQYENNFYLTDENYNGFGYLQNPNETWDTSESFIAISSDAFTDGTLLAALNGSNTSYKNWIKGPNGYPVHSDKAYLVELSINGDFKTTYHVGDSLDMSGAVFTAIYSDDTEEIVAASNIEFKGFDSSAIGIYVVTAVYESVSTDFEVQVLAENPEAITVSFVLYGDTRHGENGGTHTLADSNLTEWIARADYEIDENTTILDVFEAALTKAGLTWVNFDGNYISSITYGNTTLAEKDNGPNSGWMYTLNGDHPKNGVAEQFLSDGDCILFHYTDDFELEGAVGASAIEDMVMETKTLTVEAGKTDALTVSYTPALLNGNVRAEWSSSDTGIASMDRKGVVTGIAEGTATITAMAGGKTATATVTVTPGENVVAVESVTVSPATLTLQVGETGKLTGTILPENATAKDIQWSSDNTAVATVKDGVVTALKAGTAKITAAAGGKSASATVTVEAPEDIPYVEALKAVQAYLQEQVPNPTVGSTYGEWAVFALNRGNVAKSGWNETYLKNLKAHLDQYNGIMTDPEDRNYTEYSRVVLALTSMGVDASQITTDKATYDLVTPLLDKQKDGAYMAEWQGNNGTAFTLLALDSHDYLPGAEGMELRAGLIASLKKNRLESGAWSINGTTPNLDVTASVVYALAPYYLDEAKLTALGGTVTYAEVKEMVDGALAYLSAVQDADGGFGSSSPEADVWTLIALASIGRDAATDEAFVKADGSLLDHLLTHFDKATGGFKKDLTSKVDNQMSSEQAAYGLVAYDRFVNKKNTLYDMSDVRFDQSQEDLDEALVTVVFHLEGGKADGITDGEAKTYTKGEEGKVLPKPTRDSYSFVGWFDKADGGTEYKSVSADLPADLYAQWKSSGSGGGGGSGSSDDEGMIKVSFRLIGARKADKDVDLGKEEYMPDYVTWIATTTYNMEEGSTVYDLWVQATRDAGIRSVGAEQNYVKTVYAPSDGYALSEFTNGKRSGWMYTINGRHPGFGLKEQELHDGDRVIWHYVNDYSYEVADWFEDDSRWPSLGDGRYYNRWLKAPDRVGGYGGGLGEGAQAGGGGGSSGSISSEIAPSYDGDTVVITADVDHSEGGMAYAADAELDKKTVAEGLEKAEDKSSLKLWVDMEDSNRLVLRVETEAMKEIADAGAGLRLGCGKGVIELDADAVALLAESGREVRMVVSYNDWYDKTTVSVSPYPPTEEDLGIRMKIELPATKEGQALSVVNGDGTTTPIKKSAIIGDRVYAEVPSGTTVTITESSRYWDDVKDKDWFADAVSFVVSHELMNGVDRYEFAPNDPMTRAMLVTVLYRLEDEPEFTGGLDSFGDVDVKSWYAEAVAWASESGLVNGTENGFEPGANITREQIATILYRYAKYTGLVGEDTAAPADMSVFGDGEKVSSWAQEAMAWAVEVGLFKGDDTGSLNPQGNATRAEVATLLERLIKLIVVS